MGLTAKDIHSAKMSSYLYFLTNSDQRRQPFGFGDGIDKVWIKHPPTALVPNSTQACAIPEVLFLQGQGQSPGELPLVSSSSSVVYSWLRSPVGMLLGEHYVNLHQAQKIDVS